MPQIIRPEIKRGPAFDYGPAPLLDPLSLREGVDTFRVEGHGGSLPRGSVCTYLGFGSGKAVVGIKGTSGATYVVQIDPVLLGERGALVDSLHQDLQDFRDGYETGRFTARDEKPIGLKSRNHKPTWFGRGVAAGWHDAMAGIVDWDADVRAFNRVIRLMSVFRPAELPAPLPWEKRGGVA